MNLLLWILQLLLAFYYTMGGAWQLNTAKLPPAFLQALPPGVWTVLGALQILFALTLVWPGLTGVLPKLTPIAAILLIVQTLAIALRFTQFPGILWSVIPALLAAFVAYGRLALKPF